jgi:hypothetical protein
VKIIKTAKIKDKDVLDKLTLEKKRKDSDYDKDQLKRGIEVEKEHTKDEDFAKEISKDHLDEFSNYYTSLDKMENKLKERKSENNKNC